MRRGPEVRMISAFFSIWPMPPIPDPIEQPMRGAFSSVTSRPESFIAWIPAAMPYCTKTSIFRASFDVRYSDISKSLTLALNCVLNAETSNISIVAAPLLPATIFCHVASTVWPIELTMPRPLTTTLLPFNAITPLPRKIPGSSKQEKPVYRQ